MTMARPVPRSSTPLRPPRERRPVDESHDAEESVIGGVLLHPVSLPTVKRTVSVEEFNHPALRAIFDAIVDLDEAGAPIDPLTVVERMRALATVDRLRAFGGADFLTELMGKVITVENIEFHARIVRREAAMRRARAEAGEVLDLIERGLAAGDDPDEMLRFASEKLIASANQLALVGSSGFPTLRIADVPDLGPPRFLVESLWLDGGVGIAAGDPKSLKSFVTIMGAVCVAAGVPLFGTYPVRRGRVVVFNAEDQASLTRFRVAGICRDLGIPIEGLDLHIVNAPALFVDDPDDIRRLRQTVERLRPSLLILDPLRNLHRLDENDSAILPSVLAPLRLIQRDFGCAVQVIHHVTKAIEGRTPQSRLRGSGAIRGWYDSGWIFDRQQDDSIRVTVEHRGAPAPAPFAFRLVDVATPAGVAFRFELAPAEDDAQSATEASDTASAIERWLADHPGVGFRKAKAELRRSGLSFGSTVFSAAWKAVRGASAEDRGPDHLGDHE